MDKKLLLLYILFLFSSCAGRTGNSIPAEDFFHVPEKSNFRISPNGKYISFLRDHKGARNIYVLNLVNGNTTPITTADNRDIQFAFWANNNELVFLMKKNAQDSISLMAVNRETLVVRSILPPDDVKLRWVGPIQVINNEILISLNDRDPSFFDVYRLNISTGKRDLIGHNSGNIVRWLTDYEGKLRLAVVSDGLTETVLFRTNEDEEFYPVINSMFQSVVQPLGFTKHNRNRIYALSNRKRDKLALVEIDLITGKEMQILYQHPDVDLNAKGYSKQTGKMEFVEFDAQHPGRHFINSEIKDVFEKINSHIPNYSLELIGRDSIFTGFLVHASLDIDPGATYYYNYKNNKLLKLAVENPNLASDELAPMKPITFYTRDSIKLSGYLTIPEGAVGRMPTIVIPPMGVNARAVWGYNPEVQFLASRGYAILQVNTRGIKGFGKERWFEGFKKWGTTIQHDVTDATTWLIEEGVADPVRIGIYGFGLGGYLSLHSSCYKSNLYACAASYSGITNLFTYLKQVPPYFKPYRQMFYEMVGDPVADSEYFRRHSPVFHTDKIKHPIFIAQGGRDNRSDVNETNRFVRDLRNKSIPVKYILKNDEGHVFENEENKISLYKELASFFEKYLQ